MSVAISIRWSTPWPQLRNRRDTGRGAESTRREMEPKLDGDRAIERARARERHRERERKMERERWRERAREQDRKSVV